MKTGLSAASPARLLVLRQLRSWRVQIVNFIFTLGATANPGDENTLQRGLFIVACLREG